MKHKTVEKLPGSKILTMYKSDKVMLKCQFWSKGVELSMQVLEQDESLRCNLHINDTVIAENIKSFNSPQIQFDIMYVRGQDKSCDNDKVSRAFRSKEARKEYFEKIKGSFKKYNRENEAVEKTIEEQVKEWWKIKDWTLTRFDKWDYLHDYNADFQMYIVEQTIEKVIEILNDGWKPDFNNKDESKYFIDRNYGIYCYAKELCYNKSSMYIETTEKAKQAIKILTNFCGRDMLHYLYNSEWKK